MHTFPVFFQNPAVSISLIHYPGNNHCHITPCRRTVLAQNIRHHMRNSFFQRRLCCHIMHPFGKEQRGIHIQRSCPGKNLCISCPSQTLVTLRTVCGNIKEITSHSPLNITLQLINLIIGTGKTSGRLHICVNRAGNKFCCPDLIFRHTFYFDIAETMECKMWMKYLLTSVTDIGINRSCLPQSFGIKIAILIQNFRVRNHNLLPSFPFHMNFHKTRHILSKIKHQFTLRRCNHFFTLCPFCDSYRFTFLCCQNRFIMIQYFHRSSLEIFCLPCGINGFPIIDLAFPDFPCGHLPGIVRFQNLFCTILIQQMKFCQGSHLITIYIRLHHKPKGSLIPSICQRYLYTMPTFTHQIGHIIGLILQSLMITGPTRSKISISHTITIQSDFIQTQGGGIDACPFDFLFCTEFSEENRASLFFFSKIMSNPLSLHFFRIHQTSFKGNFSFCSISMIIPYSHAAAICCLRQKFLAGILCQNRLVTFFFSGIPNCHFTICNIISLHHLNSKSRLHGILFIRLHLP